ncbi:UNVERIFIED_CONTAM: hypothetical protein HDU68_001159 [Siphonaria sp. JEL0065]|nr:hypothetical protein HDU68_001159 [Siphonaria sp. JEL0065]
MSNLSSKMQTAIDKVADQMDSADEKVGAKIDEARGEPEQVSKHVDEKETTSSVHFGKECERAITIVSEFIGNLDDAIPKHVITNAKGLAILHVYRAGLSISARYGSGLVIARLPGGKWSAPSAIKIAGVGIGFVIGADITDFVLVLNTEDAVKAFSMGGDIRVGGDLSVAAGPIGRSAEASASITNVSPIFSYSKSKGLFAGASLDGSVVMEAKETNEKQYGRVIDAQEILSGKIGCPTVAQALYSTLDARIKMEYEAAEANASAPSA